MAVSRFGISPSLAVHTQKCFPDSKREALRLESTGHRL